MFTFYLDPALNPSAVQAGAEPYRPSDYIADQASAQNLVRSLSSGGIAVADNFFSRGQDYRKYLEEQNKLGSPVPYNPQSSESFEYYAADLARRYGMSRETAYSEAMANTAYQRAVADLQAAGLNPASLFSAGRASSAGSGYASGSSGGFTSGKSVSDPDKIPGWIFYGVQGLAQAIGTIATKSFIGGYGISQVAANLMRAYNGR